MDTAAVRDDVERFRQCLEKRGVRPARIVLFGSHAKGTAVQESDMDLVVVSADFARMDYWERVGIISDVIYELFIPLDVVAMTPEEWARGDSMVVDFAREGVVLFAA